MFIKNAILLTLAVPALCWSQGGSWDDAQRLSGVPKETIYAIALRESGMTYKDKLFRPWPWTVNSPRGSMRLASKEEAYREIKKLMLDGVTNIDVGLMQINVRWHWNTIKDLDILDPKVNLMTAANLLRNEMVASNGDVKKAVSRYHSRRKDAGAVYSFNVLNLENQVKSNLSGKL